ncbi:MAG: hypothetical protein ACPL6C_00045 [bacterium]
MIFWAIILFFLQLFTLVILYLDFPYDNIIVAIYLSLVATVMLIWKGIRKTKEHRIEKLESQVRQLLGEIDRLREQVGSKGEEE